MKCFSLYILIFSLMSYFTYSCDQKIIVKPLEEILKMYPNIKYQKCYDAITCDYKPFPLQTPHNLSPATDMLLETFILTIPNAYVQSRYGLVTFDNIFIEEFIWRHLPNYTSLVKELPNDQTSYTTEKIAVIGQFAFFNYFHWLTEVLGRLALLEIFNIEYDYLYVAKTAPFMKESLELWGINPEKIIDPLHDDVFAQAKEIILPSLISMKNYSDPASYTHPQVTPYVREKLINAALQKKASIPLAKKIFISRQDSPNRSILNENEIFELFAEQGFVRYELNKLSIVDQILLFHNAEMIAGEHGAGFANILFCKKNTKIFEIFQARHCFSFYCISKNLELDYIAIKTTEANYDPNSTQNSQVTISLNIVKNVIDTHIK